MDDLGVTSIFGNIHILTVDVLQLFRDNHGIQRVPARFPDAKRPRLDAGDG